MLAYYTLPQGMLYLSRPEGFPACQMAKGGIFEAGFGEILRPPHLQWAGKRKFALRFIKPGVTDPMLGNVTDISSRQK